MLIPGQIRKRFNEYCCSPLSFWKLNSSVEKPSTLSILSLRDWPLLSISTGEGDENDVCLGVVSWPGRAEPKRSLETPGHLCLQHRAGPLGGGRGGGGTQVKRSIRDTNCEEGQKIRGCAWNTCTHWLPHIYTLTSEGSVHPCSCVMPETVFAHTHISNCYPEDLCAHVYIHPKIYMNNGDKLPA